METWKTPNGPQWAVQFRDIDEEIHFLRKMISKYRENPVIRNLAVKIIKDAKCQMKDKRDQALAIAMWVKDNIYYVMELPERFATPTETLRAKAGDCDDMATLIGSLCESIGISIRLVVMELNGRWAHIFPAAIVTRGAGLLPLDVTLSEPIANVTNPVELITSRGIRVRLKVL
jgi:transglutaminase-like putative cysteine protease